MKRFRFLIVVIGCGLFVSCAIRGISIGGHPEEGTIRSVTPTPGIEGVGMKGVVEYPHHYGGRKIPAEGTVVEVIGPGSNAYSYCRIRIVATGEEREVHILHIICGHEIFSRGRWLPYTKRPY